MPPQDANPTPSFGGFGLSDSTISENSGGFPGGGIYNSGTLIATNSNVTGNSAKSDGGGIYNVGTLTLINSAVTSKLRNRGAGVFNGTEGTLTMANSAVSGNMSSFDGGGIINGAGAVLALVNSTVSGNVTGDNGGGIANGGTLTLTNSTVRGNGADRGGGIYNLGALEVTNSTVSGNTADRTGGGGIYNVGALKLTNSTLTGNTAASNVGGIYHDAGTVDLVNTIIAGNTASTAPECLGSLTSLGHNLLGNVSDCDFTATTGDLVGTAAEPIDAMLGPLEDNGGPTFTHALLEVSPAIDAGDDSQAQGTDHRGVPRSWGEASDIGAFELSPPHNQRIEGIATLQGQRDHSGITIHITSAPPTNGATGSFAVTSDAFAATNGADSSFTITTGPSGVFAIGIAEPGPYTVRAEHPYHLPARTTVEVGPFETISLEVELPWGDFNNDGVVDILDLSVTGGNLGKTEGRWRQP